MKTRNFSLRQRAGSFRFAWEGIKRFFTEEHNAWIHLAATVVVFTMACWLKVSKDELTALIIVTGMVWMSELFNTAIEKIMDLSHPGWHPVVKYIKDLSAAAVLIVSIAALATGAVIFIPKIP